MTVQIAGVASTPFGEHPDSSTRELFTDAALEALEDASLSVHDVEELYAGNVTGGITDDQTHVGVIARRRPRRAPGRLDANREHRCVREFRRQRASRG